MQPAKTGIEPPYGKHVRSCAELEDLEITALHDEPLPRSEELVTEIPVGREKVIFPTLGRFNFFEGSRWVPELPAGALGAPGRAKRLTTRSMRPPE